MLQASNLCSDAHEMGQASDEEESVPRDDIQLGNYNFRFYISYNILYFLHDTNVLADSLNPDLSRLK